MFLIPGLQDGSKLFVYIAKFSFVARSGWVHIRVKEVIVNKEWQGCDSVRRVSRRTLEAKKDTVRKESVEFCGCCGISNN